ncbi:hypothetical protein [Streptomyces sp. Ag109_G2-15]|uniref:hypothetical protein n=1 Tax=Streptomyces sp. Ag109_G2-15 TaxID=1938850 RepID=UPI000BE462C6|nr:hypothetical protein [Streptomyces sp. Ag109_G2-15]
MPAPTPACRAISPAFGPAGSDVEREFVRGRALADAAVAAGVEHVVFTGVASTPRSVSVLRLVRFMANHLASPLFGIDGDRPDRFAGRTLELAGDALTPTEAVAAISEATGVTMRYEQLTHAEATALNPEIAQVRERWAAGARWHAGIEALRVVHPGLRTLADWPRNPVPPCCGPGSSGPPRRIDQQPASRIHKATAAPVSRRPVPVDDDGSGGSTRVLPRRRC